VFYSFLEKPRTTTAPIEVLKGIVQRIPRGVNTKLKYIICACKLEAHLFFFLNFKGTPSQEEHKTISSGLKICKMALSNPSYFPAFFSFRKMTNRNFINSGIRQSAIAFAP
jgi:hypothetical protein